MSTYLFILGKDPELSIAELYAVYPDALFSHLQDDFLIMELQVKIDQRTLNRLGGVVKIAEIKAQVDGSDLEEAIIQALLSGHSSGKLNYGVSLYGWPESHLKTLLIGLKKSLKSATISSRFANQEFRNLSVAQHKGLKGPEIVIAKQGDVFFVGEVVATQDIDSYSKRDYEKPFRDMKVGMLPPKLAQILINLTGSQGVIWDPFCGGGVLLMEGLMMEQDMLGSDIDEETLEGARKNVDWIQNEFNLRSKATLFLHDATDVQVAKNFDAIAFEGYLGPPQTKLKSEREFKHIISQLDQLYYHFFSALKKANFKGPVVAALPFFRAMHDREISLNCIESIQDLGFELDSLLPHKKVRHLKYARRDQLVGREIYRFRLKR